MPIEIRELIIRVVIDGGAKKTDRSSSDAATQENNQTYDSNEIIQQTVEKVLEILNEKKER